MIGRGKIFHFTFLRFLSSLRQKKINRGKNKLIGNGLCTFVEMDVPDLISPPKTVSGMKVLDRSAFNKIIKVPIIKLENEIPHDVIQKLKRYKLKAFIINPVQKEDSITKILLDPVKIKKFDDMDEDTRNILTANNVTHKNFSEIDFELTYDHYKMASILKAVLPKDVPQFSSYSIIGHIVHVNLKEHLLDYKYLIAQVLLDKLSYIQTVVHKAKTIGNVYRNFEMEVLCGEPKFTVSVVEYGVKYEFDFSKVYWNPRLCEEHNRIVSMLTAKDALFDVFAGVGPFSIRAALKQCHVFANDLNPDSFKWLNHNIKLNKKSQNFITTYNKDGKDFILEDIKSNLLKLWSNEYFNENVYVVMNLPASALEFLKYFKNLITETDLEESSIPRSKVRLPIVHCHFFMKDSETVAEVFENGSGITFDGEIHKIHFVRQVSTGKGMYRVTFELPENYLISSSSSSGEPLPKRICV